MKNSRVCKHCGYDCIMEGDNFCTNCGSKLEETCPKCWVMKGKPYNCGSDKCLGYMLLIDELVSKLSDSKQQ